jgi:hypothetical protein
MKKLAALTLSLFLCSGIAFADSPKDADAQPAKDAQPEKAKEAKKTDKSDKADSAIAAEIEELRQTLQSQQEQLQLLKEELAKRDRQIDEAREAAASANSRASEASVKASEAVTTSAAAKTATDAIVSNASATPSSVTGQQQYDPNNPKSKPTPDDGPGTIRYKGVNLTPGGFLAAETIYRTRATGGDIATPFTGTPFNAADLSRVSENNFSARQSRASLLAETTIGSAKATGYYEGDFLGAGTTSNNRQTNSYVFRQRQVWGQAAFDSGFIFTGGQMWSLVTETKKGMLNRQEDLPQMIDPNYVVGFTWARQYAARFVQNFGDKFALGFSVEGPQATIGGRGFSSVTTINSAAAPATIVTSGATTATTGNFFLNAPGVGAGLYNAFDATGYTVNKAPDLIFKATVDPGFGHYEVFGIFSFFRDRIYPCGVVGSNAKDTAAPTTPTILTGNCTSATPTEVSSFGATNSSTTGGGFGASALFPLFHKHFDFGLKAVAGDGIGRYGGAQLADATARPDGTLALIRTAHGLARFEWHVLPKLDFYGYYGGEYAWRAGYSGYDTVTITKTTAIPGTATSPAIPATTATKISTLGIGGYGNFAANNSGCATEGVPVNDFNPSSGSNCAGDIRFIQEGTLGFWYRFYQGPKGRFQFGVQYSYLAKDAWSGTGGVPAGDLAISPKGINNMVWTSFRYYLP